MLNDIARVFSSQGVLIPGSERVAVSDRQGASPACDHKGADCGCFGPKFDQASAKLELSRRGREMQAAGGKSGEAADAEAAAAEAAAAEAAGAQAGKRGAGGEPLSEEDEKQVRELAKRDREVKAHEAAHQASAGGQARGGANYDYQTGPDGKRYAVGGHVDIDVGAVQGNPRATLAKAMNAQRAALAPADPSGQDRAVAAAAAQMAIQARQELAQGKGGEAGPGNGSGTGDGRASGDGGNAGGERGAGSDGAAAAARGRIRGYGRAPSAAGAALNLRA